MAKVITNFPIKGSLGDCSVYSIRTHEGLIIRSKGGPSKEQMKTDPLFVRVRENMSEFAGCGKIAGLLTHACSRIKQLADYCFTGEFVKICKIIQKRDDTHVRGVRSILISKHRDIFEGFNFNRKITFDSVVKKSPSCEISRDDFKATLSFPEIIPKLHLVNPWTFTMYRFIIVLGVVPDMVMGPYNEFVPAHSFQGGTEWIVSDWYSTTQTVSKNIMEIQTIGEHILDDSLSFFVSVGIEMGIGITNNLIQPVKYMGCSKLLAIG